MTPIKSIILQGTMIHIEDHAGGIQLKAMCPNERDAAWLAQSLSSFHGVEVHVISPSATLRVDAVS